MTSTEWFKSITPIDWIEEYRKIVEEWRKKRGLDDQGRDENGIRWELDM